MTKGSKAERAKLYKDHLVQVFLSRFLSEDIAVLEPTFDPEDGYRYPLVEAILRDPTKVEAFLAQLNAAGILEKELHDKLLFCPHCRSPRISIRYGCPHCHSFDVRKSSLMEHLPCGYIDTEDHFKQADKLICPRCGKALAKPDIDYRKAGIWCTCNDCKKSFDIPVPSHFCRQCHEAFTFEDAIYESAYAYRLSDEAKQEASLGWILIAPLREFMEDRGFEVETPGFLKGKSGASHMFDVTAFKTGAANEVTVIDLATSSENVVSEQPVIAMFAKIYDVAPAHACLVAIPKITENGRKMAKLYNITLIEARDSAAAIKALETACD